MRVIKLTQGQWAMVDNEDYKELSQYKWYAKKDHNTWYALRAVGSLPGKQKTIQMHRTILKPDKGLVVDHINHDGLDNRRFNIRVCTHAENSRNKIIQTGGTSLYKGVCWHKRDKKWAVQIKVDNKMRHLGSFKCEKEAAAAYNEAALAYHKEFAHLNVIN